MGQFYMESREEGYVIDPIEHFFRKSTIFLHNFNKHPGEMLNWAYHKMSITCILYGRNVQLGLPRSLLFTNRRPISRILFEIMKEKLYRSGPMMLHSFSSIIGRSSAPKPRNLTTQFTNQNNWRRGLQLQSISKYQLSTSFFYLSIDLNYQT